MEKSVSYFKTFIHIKPIDKPLHFPLNMPIVNFLNLIFFPTPPCANTHSHLSAQMEALQLCTSLRTGHQIGQIGLELSLLSPQIPLAQRFLRSLGQDRKCIAA